MPLPRRPVRGSRTGRALMALQDLMGRRWALRVLWELREQGADFRGLQARCEGMSPWVPHQRLTELDAQRLVAHEPDGPWRLTAQGAALVRRALPLAGWAERWAAGRRGRK